MKCIRIYLLFVLSMAIPMLSGAQALIPLPVSITRTTGTFFIDGTTKIVVGDEVLNNIAGLLNGYIQANGGKALMRTTTGTVNNFIGLSIDSILIPHKEGYRLQIGKKSICCIGHDAGGVLHGLQTLRQLWQAGKGSIQVPGYAIEDYPRFAYRGMALDVSRHMFPVSFIKKYIDWLALYKFNTFHWHLTDDQGWRIEIKKYPRLQTVAAWRKETLIGHKKELPHRFDGKRYGGYYTQQQIKEVVQYAANRQITIIPEIEMPGHASAALAAYPQLGCTGGPYSTATYWGIFEDVYCAGNDSTFAFLQNVLDEVMSLFPSTYIHIGGDECPKIRWKFCAKCQQRKQTYRIDDEHALQSYFIQRIEQYVNSKGRHIIGWDEILEGGLAPNATVMSWRGEDGGRAAIAQHHPVIMTPETHCYFDYYQSLYREEPLAAGGYTPLQKVYGYEPLAGNAGDSDLLRGLEGQAWSEYYNSEAHAAYMIFPRALALAELAWTPPSLRNYNNFLTRLRAEAPLLKKERINYNSYFDDITYTATPVQNNVLQIHLQSTSVGSDIRYTTDNSAPTENSALYTGPIAIKSTSTIKAMRFDTRHQPVGRLFQQAFRVHKAVGAAVTLQNKPIDRFNPGNTTLVNGLFGSNRYNDEQWLGFSGNDLQAVIDLGNVQTIQRLALNVLNYHWQRMWAPATLQILASVNGNDYVELYRQDSFPVNGINTLDVLVKPVQARYIKVTGINKGIIPAGEYGAGGKALLLIDEIVVE